MAECVYVAVSQLLCNIWAAASTSARLDSPLYKSQAASRVIDRCCSLDTNRCPPVLLVHLIASTMLTSLADTSTTAGRGGWRVSFPLSFFLAVADRQNSTVHRQTFFYVLLRLYRVNPCYTAVYAVAFVVSVRLSLSVRLSVCHKLALYQNG